MRYAALAALAGFLAVAIVVYIADNASQRGLSVVASAEAGEPAATQPAPETLTLAQKAVRRRPTKVTADNSPCYVCHVNYEEDEFVTVHAEENVGCMKCHGESFAHRDDEDNITPPDILYGADMIGPACAKCHETHDAPAAKVITRWKERCPAKEKPEEIVCTDCHGDHRLRFRTVWWDKKTRELVIRGKDERIKLAPDLTEKKNDEPSEGEGEPSGETR